MTAFEELPLLELNALAAEKVLGWTYTAVLAHGKYYKYWQDEKGSIQFLPDFVNDIRQAWTLVEKLGPIVNGFEFVLYWNGYGSIWQAGWFEWEWGEIQARMVAESRSVPCAITLAALKAAEALTKE